MKYSQWIGFVAMILVAVSCYLPWLSIPAINTTVTGMDGTGTNFGKPAKLHLIFCVITGILFLIPKVWAKRINWIFCGMNVAWAIRNFLLYARCEMGSCPERKIGLYLLLISSIIMLVAALFPDLKVKPKTPAITPSGAS